MITLKHITKTFTIKKEVPEESNMLVKKTAVEEFTAVKAVDLQIKTGECFGIIGRNGCGKTTLLKIIAGILKPTSGNVEITGKIMSFIELGVGLQGDLSGNDNIYLYGSLLGIPKKEIDRKKEWIIEFSGLHEFIHAQLRTYSSGMKVRLAFATAMMHDPDVLLIDEILAVGDASFYEKSFSKIRSLKEKGKTIVIVSHDLHQLRRICDRMAYMEKGEIIAIGKPEEVIRKYLTDTLSEDASSIAEVIDKKKKIIRELRKKLQKQPTFLEKMKGQQAHLQEELEDHVLNLVESLENHKKLLALSLEELENQESELNRQKRKEMLQILEEMKQTILVKKEYDAHADHARCNQEILTLMDKQASLLVTPEEWENNRHSIREGIHLIGENLASSSETKTYSLLNTLVTFSFYLSKTKDTAERLEAIKEVSHLLSVGQKKVKDESLKKIQDNFSTIIQHLAQSSHQYKQQYANLMQTLDKMIERGNKVTIKLSKAAEIVDVKVRGKDKKETKMFLCNDPIIISIRYRAHQVIDKPSFGIGIFDDQNMFLFGPNTATSGFHIGVISDEGTIEFVLHHLPFLEGTYFLSISITDEEGKTTYDFWDKKIKIQIKKGKIIQAHGSLFLPHTWSHAK